MRREKLLVLTASICIITALALLPFMSACKPAPTLTPTPPPPPSPPAPPAKPIRLLFASWDSPNTTTSAGVMLFKSRLEELQKKGGSNVELELSFGGALGKGPDHYDMAVEGIADITAISPGWTPGRFPITDGFSFAHLPNPAPGAEAFARFIEAGYLDKEYEDVKIFDVFLGGANQLWMRKPISSLADLKGKKIRSFSPVTGAVCEGLGAVPVSMSIGEVYVAMEKGVLDGALINYGASYAQKLYEVAEYMLEISQGNNPMGSVMNKKVYENLPADVKAIVDEGFVERSMACGAFEHSCTELTTKAFLERGGVIDKASPAETAQLNEIMAKLCDAWITNLNSKGIDGQKMYEAMKSCFEDAGVGDYFGR